MKSISPLRQRILDKISPKIAKLKEAWQHLYGSQFRTNPLTATWSLAQKIRQKRILERQLTFQRAGGNDASIVSYGMNKARSKD
jgi:hypothetical protein